MASSATLDRSAAAMGGATMITVGKVEDDAVVRNRLARLIGETRGFRCLAALNFA